VNPTRRPEPLVWELALIGLGVMLRVSMYFRFDVRRGFDWWWHWQYVWWAAHHWTLPNPDQSLEFFHPPLYYFLAGGMVRLGAEIPTVAWLSIACGCLRLLVITWALRRWVPDPLARLPALALAAVLPASVFLDGMETGEALSNLLCVLALVVGAASFERLGLLRVRGAALTGLLVGLALLTKVSAVTLVAALAMVALLELAQHRDPLRRLAPWLAALALIGATTGWYFARNHRLKGQFLLSSFDCYEHHRAASIEGTPYRERRERDFVTHWSLEVHDDPYLPSATKPPRFFPMLLASTFVDYYNFGFKRHPAHQPYRIVNTQSLPPEALWPSRLSFHGGLVIALVTVAAWLAVAWQALRRRRADWQLFLAVPLLTLLAQLHFAWKYPFESLGVVKGVYLQYGAPPLYALFGLGVAWLWRRPIGRPFAVVALASLGLVASYTVYCRLL
jgi:4-amino-4-deoxy-L-arabinose transferase-like glycosyltransferase